MIIKIREELLQKVTLLMKNQDKAIYEELLQIKPLDNIPTNSLQKAREVKSEKIKQSIKETIKSLCDGNMKVSKYQIHKRTGIAYATLNKYYDDILQEFKGR